MEYVKICGLKDYNDIEVSIQNGANAVGFIYNVPSSPRNLDQFQIESLISKISNKIIKVIVFKPYSIEDLITVMNQIKTDLYQIHTNFSLKQIEQIPENLKKKIILALNVNIKNKNLVITKINNFHDQFYAFLIDNSEGHGNKINLELIKDILDKTTEKKIIIAGGIAEDNIEEIYQLLNPYGIDISSSLESEKGVKDSYKIKSFLGKVKKIKTELGE